MHMFEQIDFAVHADNLYFEHDVPTDNAGALNQNVLSLSPTAFATPQGTQRNSAGTTNLYVQSLPYIQVYSYTSFYFFPWGTFS